MNVGKVLRFLDYNMKILLLVNSLKIYFKGAFWYNLNDSAFDTIMVERSLSDLQFRFFLKVVGLFSFHLLLYSPFLTNAIILNHFFNHIILVINIHQDALHYFLLFIYPFVCNFVFMVLFLLQLHHFAG